MERLIVIPAHSGSKRLPGKVLREFDGVSLLERTYRQARKVDEKMHVYVASGDGLIDSLCKSKGMNFVPVHEPCKCGTERVWKAVLWLKRKINRHTRILNWQADWPGISPVTARVMFELLKKQKKCELITAVGDLAEKDRDNRNVVKASVSGGKAFRFTRRWIEGETQCHHQGIYGFTPQKLKECAELNGWFGTFQEDLEQTLWLAHGHGMDTVTGLPACGIDGPEDWEKLVSSAQIETFSQAQSNHPKPSSGRKRGSCTGSRKGSAA